MGMDEDRKEYKPELIPRRGEVVAWALFFMVAAPWLGFRLFGIRLPFILPLFGGVLFLAAASISLGNWMDRHTLLHIDADGLAYRNGLRDVHLKWDQVKEVRVSPSTWSKKVWVIGEQARFDFNTLGEVKYRGELKGRTGFVDGEEIIRQIVLNSGLEIVEQLGDIYYYARR
jgi:hypothetical protein